MLIIGIDLGGTKVSAALFSGKRELKRERFMIEMKTREAVVEQMFRIFEKISSGKKISAVGIGVPGSVKDGRSVFVPNIPSLNDTPLKKAFEKKFRVRAAVENDADCFAFGESILRKEKDLIGITIGTGLGGGVVIGGEIYHGNGSAAHFGHMTIDMNGRKCSCGSQGCLEQYASGRAIEDEAEKIYGERIKPESLANLARRGDAKAMQVFDTFGKHLGIGLSNINFMFNPQTIVLGGGVSQASDVFLPSALDEMRKRCFLEIPKILTSSRDCCFGAAMVAIKGKK